jgi:hypothetical protein
MSFSKNGIRFSSACIQKFMKTEYVEIKVEPFTHVIAVLPCSEHNNSKMRWAKIYADYIGVRTISAKAFLDTLFELFNWDIDKRYRLRGEIIQTGRETIAMFDSRKPEIFSSRSDMIMPWLNGFGDDYYGYRKSRPPISGNVDIFSEYDNNSDLQPTGQDEAYDNIRLLIEKMQKDGRCLDNATDILN